MFALHARIGVFLLIALFSALHCSIAQSWPMSSQQAKNDIIVPSIQDPPPKALTALPEEEGGMTGEFTVGYDTRYLFRGFSMLNEYGWSQVQLTMPLNDKLSFSFTPYVGRSMRGNYAEFDAIGMLDYQGEGFALGAGFLWYNYQGYYLDNQYEINLIATKELGDFEMGLLYAYEFVIQGHYLEFSLSREWALTEKVSLALSAVLAMNHNYNSPGTTLDHAYFSAALPMPLTETISLNPYLGLNWAFQGLQNQGEARKSLFGGISMNWTF